MIWAGGAGDLQQVIVEDVDEFSTVFEMYAAMALGTAGDFNFLGTH